MVSVKMLLHISSYQYLRSLSFHGVAVVLFSQEWASAGVISKIWIAQCNRLAPPALMCRLSMCVTMQGIVIVIVWF